MLSLHSENESGKPWNYNVLNDYLIEIREFRLIEPVLNAVIIMMDMMGIYQ